jgi:hypothetical protein
VAFLLTANFRGDAAAQSRTVDVVAHDELQQARGRPHDDARNGVSNALT